LRIDTHLALKVIFKYLSTIYKVNYNGTVVYMSSYKYDYLKTLEDPISILIHKVDFLPNDFFSRPVDFTADYVYGWSCNLRIKTTPCSSNEFTFEECDNNLVKPCCG
jgi:hypothetical protein